MAGARRAVILFNIKMKNGKSKRVKIRDLWYFIVLR